MAEIRAITFDIWDTLLIDDSDEPKRKEAGRPTKCAERRILLHRFLEKHGPIEKDTIDRVYDAVDAAFNKVWKELFVTWSVAERLMVILDGLGRELPQDEFMELVRFHEDMELEFMPELIAGVRPALMELKKYYSLGIISDTIFSPGRSLRKILTHYDILDCFDAFVFSDEAGRSKPHGRVFRAAVESLGVDSENVVHIGDREANDIGGAPLAGAVGVLCTASKDRGSGGTKAAAIFDDYDELPGIIESLNI